MSAASVSSSVVLEPTDFGEAWVRCVVCDGRGVFEMDRGEVSLVLKRVLRCWGCAGSGVQHTDAAQRTLHSGDL